MAELHQLRLLVRPAPEARGRSAETASRPDRHGPAGRAGRVKDRRRRPRSGARQRVLEAPEYPGTYSAKGAGIS